MSSQLAVMIARSISTEIEIKFISRQVLWCKFEFPEEARTFVMELGFYPEYNFRAFRELSDNCIVVVFC